MENENDEEMMRTLLQRKHEDIWRRVHSTRTPSTNTDVYDPTDVSNASAAATNTKPTRTTGTCSNVLVLIMYHRQVHIRRLHRPRQ